MAVLSSSCELRPPLWSNINNEIEDIKSLTPTAVEGRFELPRFVVCVACLCVHLLKAGGFLAVRSPTRLLSFCTRVALAESACSVLHKANACFSFDSRCSDLHSLRSCGYCPNSDNPAES